MENNNKDQYIKNETEREKYTDAILNSDSRKKIIIAGPGTGKSFLFQQICEDSCKDDKAKILVLSFINELVDDLVKDLHKYKIAEVRTLHSFALSQLNYKKFFLDLGAVIEEDYRIINNKEVNFNKIFCNFSRQKKSLDFYSKRRTYYDYLSPNCSVHVLVRYFEEDESEIPLYSQILIDEFQDFNKLEARLIDLLSKKSPILIVGDDDQSLYSSFRYADLDEIRSKNKLQEYTSFELPFCSRCTEVIMNSFNSVINKAKEKGFLGKRVDKQYKYFPSKDKDKMSSENSKILVKKKVYQKSVAYNIEQEINKFFDSEDKEASVLIICSLKKQINDLEKRLCEKGFRNIQIPRTVKKRELIDGLNLLLKDKECNLGWRVVSKYIFKDKFKDVIKKSYVEGKQMKFKDLLGPKDRKYVRSILTIMRKIRRKEEVSNDDYDKIFNCFNYDMRKIVIQELESDLKVNSIQKKVYRDMPIRITSILGSKGLTNDYVFLVNFDDKYILDDGGKKITDENICKFLVALTRAKRRVYIYTGENKLPTFISWIDEKYIQLEG